MDHASGNRHALFGNSPRRSTGSGARTGGCHNIWARPARAAAGDFPFRRASRHWRPFHARWGRSWSSGRGGCGCGRAGGREAERSVVKERRTRARMERERERERESKEGSQGKVFCYHIAFASFTFRYLFLLPTKGSPLSPGFSFRTGVLFLRTMGAARAKARGQGREWRSRWKFLPF